MQVVYSVSPIPSPLHSPRMSPKMTSPRSPSPGYRPYVSSRSKSPKGTFGWRPIMPGYKAQSAPSVVIQRTVNVHHVSDTDSSLKESIPAMSKGLAVTCLVLNVLSPGLGTFTAGLSVLCCSRVRSGGGDKMNVVWVNTWVALLQFLTAFLFLLGWIWSIMWGATFLAISEAEANGERMNEHSAAEDTINATDFQSPRLPIGSATVHATTTTTTLSVQPNQDSNQQASAPIIVLQHAPYILQPQTRQPIPNMRPIRSLNPHNPRHQRILRRQAEVAIPSMFLDAERLEQIVIHNAPLPGGVVDDSEHLQLANKS